MIIDLVFGFEIVFRFGIYILKERLVFMRRYLSKYIGCFWFFIKEIYSYWFGNYVLEKGEYLNILRFVGRFELILIF